MENNLLNEKISDRNITIGPPKVRLREEMILYKSVFIICSLLILLFIVEKNEK